MGSANDPCISQRCAGSNFPKGSSTLKATWGKVLYTTDEEVVELNMGIPFRFYGKTYTKCWVNVDGYVAFEKPPQGKNGYTHGQNSSNSRYLPYPDIGPLIAVYWEDFAASGTVQYGNFTHNGMQAFMVTFSKVKSFHEIRSLGMASWQLILHVDGSIDFIFERVEGDEGIHTIGFHNQSDGHMLCRGKGSECTFANTQFHVTPPVEHPPATTAKCADLNNGNYTCTYEVSYAGKYLTNVRVAKKHIATSNGQFNTDIAPGSVDTKKCDVYGNGIFDGIAGKKRYLTIVSRDKWSNARNDFDDSKEFVITTYSSETMSQTKSRKVYNSTTGNGLSANLYEYISTLTKSGTMTVQVMYTNIPIVEPQEFYIHPAATSAKHSTVEGRGTTLATQHQATPIVITARDIYGNARESGGDKVTVKLVAVNTAIGKVTDNYDGTYTAVYTVTIMGTYSLLVRIIPPLADQKSEGIHIKGSPFSVQNLDANQKNPITGAKQTFCFGDGLKGGVVGIIRSNELALGL